MSILSRISMVARSMLVPPLNCMWIKEDDEDEVELRLSRLLMVAKMSSMGRVMVRSTSSGEEDG
ncbi:hypothetical protein ES703_112307 [subsurface metagenome]